MEDTITIPRNFFEHLLACLDNQKFIHNVNADGLAEGEEAVKLTQANIQQAIDKASRTGYEMLLHGNMEWSY